MYKLIIAFALLVTVSNAQNLVGWRNCGTPMADIHHIIVQSCTETPCLFVPGNIYQLQMTGAALVNTDSLNYELTVDFLGLSIPLASGNACNNLVVGQCPAQAGLTFSYILNQSIPNLFPSLSTFVRLIVRHHDGTMGISVEVDVFS